MHFRNNQEYLRFMTSGMASEDLRETEKEKRMTEEKQPEEEVKPKRGRKARDG